MADNYIGFYFRFVERYRDEVELESLDFWGEFLEEYNAYLGGIFEDVARQFLIKLNKAGRLPFRFTKVGRWWRKGEEIDIVALNERERRALLVEIKWKDLSMRKARGVLKDLERKGELIGLEGWEKSYGLVARKVKGKERLGENGFLAWDLSDFVELRP
ncbi:DUF234 domain-containing protein [Thermococcus sp.]|uniref:DUF234 domain-containing protein n=1 Tax=Thermococcus sp. TaxID=35749 RepID=UPI002618D3B6|nr:DUF234 domain-containing protein [Thermococcus sp.]